MSIIVGTFKDLESAEKAVHAIRRQGVTDEEISIIAREDALVSGNAQGDEGEEITYSDQDVSDGALTGGAIGAIGGLMVGAGALAIPGIGPLVAAGPIAAGLSGAAAGGVAGGLLDLGIPEERGKHYEEEIRKGSILAIVQATQETINDVSSILRRYGAHEVEEH